MSKSTIVVILFAVKKVNIMVNKMAVFILLLIPFYAFSQSLPTAHDPIKIMLNNWTSQLVISHIVGNLFRFQGYQIEYVTEPVDGQWFMLKSQKGHVQVEVWQGTMSEKYQQTKAGGWLVDAGAYDISTREDWWYPKYVEELCPGLPDWRALKKCYGLFSDKGDPSRGIYYGGPWEKPDRARVRALGLPFTIFNVRSGDELWVLLEEAYEKKQAILLFNWTPNWVGAVYEGNFVDFPDHHSDCEIKPEWGVNSKFLYDCGNPKSGWLKKVVSTGFPEVWPCPFEILSNMNFNNAQMESIAALVDKEKMTVQHAADYWLNKHTKIWKTWIPKTCGEQ